APCSGRQDAGADGTNESCRPCREGRECDVPGTAVPSWVQPRHALILTHPVWVCQPVTGASRALAFALLLPPVSYLLLFVSFQKRFSLRILMRCPFSSSRLISISFRPPSLPAAC